MIAGTNKQLTMPLNGIHNPFSSIRSKSQGTMTSTLFLFHLTYLHLRKFLKSLSPFHNYLEQQPKTFTRLNGVKLFELKTM